MGDVQFTKYPDLQLAHHIFHITNPASSRTLRESSLKSLQDAIRTKKMAPLYRHLSHPVEGLMNAVGEGSAQLPAGGLRRISSSAHSLLARRPSFDLPMSWDEALYEELKADNEKELEEIRKEEDEAQEKAGETEVHTARGKRAEFLTRIGEKVWNFKAGVCQRWLISSH